MSAATIVRPLNRADKRRIDAWWASLNWVQKRRAMEICSRLPASCMADSIEHAKQLREGKL